MAIGQLLLDLLATASSEDGLLSDLAALFVERTQADSCDIMLRDRYDQLTLRASTLAPELNMRLKLGRGIGICGQTLETGAPMFLVSRAFEHPDFATVPGIDDAECNGAVVLPLKEWSLPFGVILLRSALPWKSTSSSRASLMSFAERCSKCVVAYRNAYESGGRTNRLGALSEVAKTIATSPYLEEILQLLVHLTAQQFNYRVVTVRLLDENREELVLRATQASAKAYQRKRAIKLGESMAGRAIAQNRIIIVPDVQLEKDYIGHDLAEQQGLRSMICVPLTIQKRPVGVLTCYTDVVRDFHADEVKALETLAKQAAVSIEHAKLQVRHTLMQEMHHRVKNNLQQVASLLRLQMRFGTYKSLEELLGDSIARILAIASVHDLLSREDLDHVGIRSIAEMLVQHQQSSLILPDRSIGFQVRGEDVHLNMTQATQIALVLNELVQNAVEHGFRATVEGEVHITVEEDEMEVSVWVSNSGDQLPVGFQLSDGHLGLQIVDSLCHALNGRFKMEDRLGWTVAEVKFQRASGE